MSPILPLHGYGHIADSLAIVERIRLERQQDTEFAAYTTVLKRWQAQRFRDTYADILQDRSMGPAALFFLTELYSELEYAQRDAEFARIAVTLERVFPQSVVNTACLLAQLHALSESLDACMTRAWLTQAKTGELDLSLYRSLWQSLSDLDGYQAGRVAQAQAAQMLGQQLEGHTATPGLLLMLKLMRGPASAAGLHHLQQFLERGFDTFRQLGRAGAVAYFLQTIAEREQRWLEEMAA